VDEVKLLSQQEAVTESANRLSKSRELDWGLYGYDTGLHGLNMAIGGWVPTRLTVIGARSGSGKTALLCPIFDAASRKTENRGRIEVLLFSWELDATILIDRLICSKTGLSLWQLNQGAKLLGEQTMGYIKTAYSEVIKYPITYQTATLDIYKVERVIRKFKEKCDEMSEIEGAPVQPLVILDYLNMAKFGATAVRTYGISDFINRFKQLCNEHKLCGVMFAQLSRQVDRAYTNDNTAKPPDRADFSDSSSIENASDNLIVLWRPEYHRLTTFIDPGSGLEVPSSNKALFRILKCRDYGTSEFVSGCDMKCFKFWHPDHAREFPYWELYNDPEFWKSQLYSSKQLTIS